MCRVAATKPAQSASLKLQNHGRYPVSRCFPVASTSKYYLKMTNIISVLYKIILFAEFTVYNVVKTLRPKAWKDGQRLIVFTVSDFKRFDLFTFGEFLKGRRHTEACMKHGCWLNMMFERCFSLKSFEVFPSIVDKSWNTS